jgi:hypothetical protein
VDAHAVHEQNKFDHAGHAERDDLAGTVARIGCSAAIIIRVYWFVVK